MDIGGVNWSGAGQVSPPHLLTSSFLFFGPLASQYNGLLDGWGWG